MGAPNPKVTQRNMPVLPGPGQQHDVAMAVRGMEGEGGDQGQGKLGIHAKQPSSFWLQTRAYL